MIHDTILGTIGNTPIVRLRGVPPGHVEMFVKCEFGNPGTSVKDRAAVAMIEDAERRGVLEPGMTVVEPTSGSTGISLAMVCAAKGYRFVAVIKQSSTANYCKMVKLLGAKVVRTPTDEGGKGMVMKAQELAETHGWFLPNQFANPANPAGHRSTTAPEILSDFRDRRLNYFVSGMGTGGTITGTGQILKAARPDLTVVVTEPAGAQILAGREWNQHEIHGWTPNFIPAALDREVYDRIVPVTDVEARDTARDLAAKEGLICGLSAGGTVAAALKVSADAAAGSVILAILPDSAERYLSTFLFEGIDDSSDATLE